MKENGKKKAFCSQGKRKKVRVELHFNHLFLHSQRIICKGISRRMEYKSPCSALKKSPTLSYLSTGPGHSHANGLTPKPPTQWAPNTYSLPRSLLRVPTLTLVLQDPL